MKITMGADIQITGMRPSYTNGDLVHLVVKSSSSNEHIYVIYDFAAAQVTHANLITGVTHGPNLSILT